jgi:hypothetical protein
VTAARAFASRVLAIGGVAALARMTAYIVGGITALAAALHLVGPAVGQGVGSTFDAVLFEQRADGTRSVRPWVLIGGAAFAALILARVVG